MKRGDRRALAAVAVIAALAMTGPSNAARFKDQVIPGASHVEGEAKWTESLERKSSTLCALTGTERALKLGDSASPEPRRDSKDCVENSVLIRNDSPRALQCLATIDSDTPDDRGLTRSEVDAVILPGEDAVGRIVGPAALLPRTSTTCRLLPAPPLADLVVPDSCTVDGRTGNPADYYPPGSIRRNEEGNVTVDFTLHRESKLPTDVQVMASSGFADLDNAAMKFIKRIRATSSCDGQRFRKNVRFSLGNSVEPMLTPTR